MCRFLWLIAVAALFSSCCRSTLICRTELLDPLFLAGEQLETPDPHRRCFYGQQIVVFWRLPSRCFSEPVELVLNIRYGNLETQTVTTELTHSAGFWTYRIMNEEFECLRGISAFQAQIWRGDCLLDEWTHSLWTNLIEISPRG